MKNIIRSSAFYQYLIVLAEKLGFVFFVEHIMYTYKFTIKNPERCQMEFLTMLDSWLKDGTNLLVATQEIKKSELFRGKTKSFNYRASLDIENSTMKGESLSKGMGNCFQKEIISLVKVGEKTGNISDVVSTYIANNESRKKAAADVIKTLIYPIGLLTLILSMFLAIHNVGLPLLDDKGLKYENLTGLPQDVISFSGFISASLPAFNFICGLLFFAYFLLRNNYTGKYRKSLDKLFPFNVHKEFVSMSFIQTFAILSKEGVPILQSMELMRTVSTTYEAMFINKIILNIGSKSNDLAEYLNVGLLNREVHQRLSAVANQQNSDAKVRAVQAAARESVQLAVKRLSNSFKIGRFVLWVLVTMLGLFLTFGLVFFSFQSKNLIML